MKYTMICDVQDTSEIYTTSTGFLKCKGNLLLQPVPDSPIDVTYISQLDPTLIANAVGSGFVFASVLFAMAFGLKVIVKFIKSV